MLFRSEFSHPVSSFIRERRWHHSQRIIAKENDKIELQLEVGVTPELVQWILGYGPSVKVLGPDSLKSEVKEQAQKTLKIYEDLKDVG